MTLKSHYALLWVNGSAMAPLDRAMVSFCRFLSAAAGLRMHAVRSARVYYSWVSC